MEVLSRCSYRLRCEIAKNPRLLQAMYARGNPRRGVTIETLAGRLPVDRAAMKKIQMEDASHACVCTFFLNVGCVHAPCTRIAVTTAVSCALPKLAPQCCGNNCRACAFS